MQHEGTSQPETRVRDAAPQLRGRVPKPFEFAYHVEREIKAIRRTAVCQAALRLPPHALVGVEFRRVGRQELQMQAGHLPAELPDELAAVHAEVVPHQHDGTAQVTEQVLQERDRLRLADIVVMPLVVQADTPPRRAHRDPRDHRDPIVALRVVQVRRLTPWRPGPHHGGREHEARFVYEDEVGPQEEGPLFTRGQRVRFQRAMASSSRSRGRRSGFCGLQSLRASSRPTWSR